MIKPISKICLVLLVFLGLLFSSWPLSVSASAQFATGYDISFDFADSGVAQVTQKIALTNLTDNFYASEYSLTISSDKITNVSGSDGSGAITVTTKTQNNQTTLMAALKQKVVGKDKTTSFQISYAIDSLALKRGRVWEINIPQIQTSENVSGYKLTLAVPNTFGKIGKMSPTADQTVAGASKTQYIFTQTAASTSGIGATFGDYQLFKFTLKYRYKNPNLYSAQATIALPPDTEYQALYYQSLDPRPAKIEMDDNGNYLATYTIKGNTTLEVITQGYAQLVDAAEPFQIPKNWSQEELSKFTKSDKYLESQNSQIQKKAKELSGIKEIYDYVTQTLKYDFNRLNNDTLGRRGALEAFNRPEQSICTDFSDLFVALARAKGIPARGLIGFAYADNSNLRPTKIEGLVDTTVLHAWPEYYDSEKGYWIQVDPTWGSTTGGVDYFNRLDTNHFVFAIYGSSSEYPYPAGAYKLSENEIDDVKVEVVDEEIGLSVGPTLAVNVDQVISGFPTTAKLFLENTTGRALFKTKLVVEKNTTLGINEEKVIESGTLLPFAKNSHDLKLRSSSLLDNRQTELRVTLLGSDKKEDFKLEETKTLQIKSFFSFGIPQGVLIVIFLLVIASWVQPQLTRFRSSS